MPHPKHTDLDMTKHSDYFVWKDTLECVARRCDYAVDKKRVNSCVLKHCFLEGVDQPKISPKKPRNALSDALLMSRFQNFAANAAKKRLRFAWFELINWFELIRCQTFWEVAFFTMHTCARWIAKALLANLVATPRCANRPNMYVLFVGVQSFSRWFVGGPACLSFQKEYTLWHHTLSDDIVLSFCLSMYLTLFTDPDCCYLSWCSECSETPWYPLKGSRNRLDACQGHMLVVRIDETRAADESMHTGVRGGGALRCRAPTGLDQSHEVVV